MGPADVGRARVGQQTGLEHHRGEPQRGVARDRVERGDPDQVPQGLDGTRRLTVRGQPAAEVLCVQGRIGEVEPAQRERGTAHGGALGEREMRIRGQAPAQVEGHGQRVAPQSAEPSARGPGDVDDGHVEALLQRCQRGAPDPVEEPAVGGAAAQIDVLAVVHGQVAAPEREGQAAQSRPALEQGDADPRVRERERGGDPGEPAADDDGTVPGPAPPGAPRRFRGPLAVGHRPPSSARPPRWRSRGVGAVSVRDAAGRRRVARRFPSPASLWTASSIRCAS